MRKLFHFIRLYFSFAGITIKSEMVHRASFITGVVGQWLSYGATFLTLYVLIQSFGALGGWSGDEVLFFYAFNLLAYALAASVFFIPCRSLGKKMVSGEFDASLTKPVSPLAQEILMGYNFGYIGHTILAMVVLIYATSQLGIAFSLSRLLIFALMLIGAALAQGAVLLAGAALSFWVLGRSTLADLLFSAMRNATRYPISIYGVVIQFLLTFVLPGAFMNFYPSIATMGRLELSPFWRMLPYLSPLVGLLMLVFAVALWNRGLKRYQSAGT